MKIRLTRRLKSEPLIWMALVVSLGAVARHRGSQETRQHRLDPRRRPGMGRRGLQRAEGVEYAAPGQARGAGDRLRSLVHRRRRVPPARAALLTGKFTIHDGVSRNNDDLPCAETTIAEALKSHGYTTALFGKWHHGKPRGRKILRSSDGSRLRRVLRIHRCDTCVGARCCLPSPAPRQASSGTMPTRRAAARPYRRCRCEARPSPRRAGLLRR